MRPWDGSSTARSPRGGAGRAPCNEAVLEPHQSLHHLAPALLPGNAVPPGRSPSPQRVASVPSRRSIGVVGHSRSESSTHARRSGWFTRRCSTVTPRAVRRPVRTRHLARRHRPGGPGARALQRRARPQTWCCSAPRVRWRDCCANDNGGCPRRARCWRVVPFRSRWTISAWPSGPSRPASPCWEATRILPRPPGSPFRQAWACRGLPSVRRGLLEGFRVGPAADHTRAALRETVPKRRSMRQRAAPRLVSPKSPSPRASLFLGSLVCRNRPSAIMTRPRTRCSQSSAVFAGRKFPASVSPTGNP